MWFKCETNLATMIELLRVVKDKLKKKPYESKGQVVKARLEMSPQKKPLAKAHAFHKGMSAAKGDESKINVIYDKLHMSFLIGRVSAAKFTPEGEGLTDQGWTINHDVISAICIEYTVRHFLWPLFESR